MENGVLLQISSNILFWGGIILMGIAAFNGILSGMILFLRGKIIKKELESDYGKIGKETDRRN